MFDNFNYGNKYEFLGILQKMHKFINKKKLTWLDYGCGRGSELKIVSDNKIKAMGFEPNKALYKICVKNKLNVVNKLQKINKKFDVIFTRNTFKYIDSFPDKIKELSLKLNKNGLFVWRDKYFNFHTLDLGKEEESLLTGSFLFKKTIFYYLSINNLKIMKSKFYLDGSFLIIAKKTNKKTINRLYFNNFFVSQKFLIKNQKITSKIFAIRSFIKNIKFFLVKLMNLN